MQWNIISPAFPQYGTLEGGKKEHLKGKKQNAWKGKTERLKNKRDAYKEKWAGAYEKNRRNGLQEYVQKNKQTKTIQKPEKRDQRIFLVGIILLCI